MPGTDPVEIIKRRIEETHLHCGLDVIRLHNIGEIDKAANAVASYAEHLNYLEGLLEKDITSK